MKKTVFILFLYFFTMLSGGCSKVQVDAESKMQSEIYEEQTIDLKAPLRLYIQSDCSNIEIYTWKKNKVKFEVTKKVSGMLDKGALDRKLKDLKVKITEDDEGEIKFTSKYAGSKSDIDTVFTNVKIYIPKKIDIQEINLESGSLKIYDDMECNLRAEIGKANIDINRIEGVINLRVDAGNVRINGGRLENNSTIEINKGNIDIKTELKINADYKFGTNIGFINLNLPEDSAVRFDNTGNVEINEFENTDPAAKVRLKCEIGKIYIKKYREY